MILFPKNRRCKKELTNCQNCEELLTDDNWSDSNKKHKRYICKTCWNSRQKQYTENSKSKDPNFNQKKKERTKKWIEGFSEERKLLESRKRYNSWLKRTYKISIEDYNNILLKQDNKCSICGIDKPSGMGTFHVDHDHFTGKVRGLLCHHCNFLLGNCKENIEILEKAKNYLLFHKK